MPIRAGTLSFNCFVTCVTALVAVAPHTAVAQGSPASSASKARAAECPSCAEWNLPQKPFQVVGNTYYVGTRNLGAVLITSPKGHILVDGALPESAPLIAASIVQLGFRVEDIKFIVNSHDHFDHAGGISELQKRSGAKVIASPSSARVLRAGASESDDPQFGVVLKFPKVSNVSEIKDNDSVRVGDVAIAAHFTGGHTPGGTSWSWISCAERGCLNMVYADSENPVSADGFYYTRSKTYPTGVQDFEHAFKVLEQLPCDVLITPHPEASGFWQRVAARDSGRVDGLVDVGACKRYVATARERLAKRIATETAKP